MSRANSHAKREEKRSFHGRVSHSGVMESPLAGLRCNKVESVAYEVVAYAKKEWQFRYLRLFFKLSPNANWLTWLSYNNKYLFPKKEITIIKPRLHVVTLLQEHVPTRPNASNNVGYAYNIVGNRNNFIYSLTQISSNVLLLIQETLSQINQLKHCR